MRTRHIFYSIAVDEVIDCASLEQMLVHIGWVERNSVSPFQLEVVEVLKKDHSTDADTQER